MPKFKEPQFEKALTTNELQERLRDPNFLPTRKQITEAFTDDIQWRKFCYDKDRPVFEFLNEEYIDALSKYLVSRIKEYRTDNDKPLTILEIGAGNGKLSHFLRQKLDDMTPGQALVVATDSGELDLKNDFPVERLKHNDALEKYSPGIVIFSWMPYKKDSSKDIRKFSSVQEYILIGESHGGCCGDAWETWGLNLSDSEDDKKVPPYKVDGFEMKELYDLNKLQICRSDDPGKYSHSATVAFIRRK